jgi:hypothetical protein
MLETLADTGRALLYLAGLVVLIGAVAHGLGWVLTRRRTVRWVWRAWNVLGVLLLVSGVAAMGVGWMVLGWQTGMGSAVTGLGLLLASVGLWMIVPV